VKIKISDMQRIVKEEVEKQYDKIVELVEKNILTDSAELEEQLEESQLEEILNSLDEDVVFEEVKKALEETNLDGLEEISLEKMKQLDARQDAWETAQAEHGKDAEEEKLKAKMAKRMREPKTYDHIGGKPDWMLERKK